MFFKNKKANGFTLIELLISIAIMAILAAISYISYTEYVYKSRRTDAKSTLIKLAIAQEKFYQQHFSYSADITSSSGLNHGTSESEHNYYTLTVTVTDEGVDGFASFTLTATAQASQLNDEDCVKFSLDHLNNQQSYSVTDQPTDNCW